MSAATDCLCCGIVVSDHVCEPIERIPRGGELLLTPAMHLTVGGCASNVAVNLARLGPRTGIVGLVGRDVFGRHVRESLEAAGVDCRNLRESSQPTSGTLVINVRGEDRRFIHCVGANDEFDGSQITPALIETSRCLYVGGYCLSERLSPDAVARVFTAARAAGAITVLDVVAPPRDDFSAFLDPVLPLTDLFVPNDDEARLMTGLDDPRRQAEAFHDAGARTVVVTCGDGGAVLVSDETCLRVAAHQVDYVDGTGSGDAFTAGFVFGLLRGASAEQCLAWGSALGASCVRSMGATAGALDAAELDQFVAAHPLKIQRC